MNNVCNFYDSNTRNRLTEFEEFCIGHWALYNEFKRALKNASEIPLIELTINVMEICRRSWKLPLETRQTAPTLRCIAAERIMEFTKTLTEEKEVLVQRNKALQEKVEYLQFRSHLRTVQQNQEIFRLQKENEDLKKRIKYIQTMTPEKRQKIEEM